MPYYRKKPVVIEAVQVPTDPDDLRGWHALRTFVGNGLHFRATALEDPVRIETLEGTMIAGPGDYVIRGVEGELYPCKASIFEKTYEPAEEEDLHG